MRVGALDVSILVDAEGSFATLAEAFPALSSNDEWRLPVNAVLIRGAGTTLLVDTGLGPEPRAFMPDGGARLLEELASAGTVVGHFHGPGRFTRSGDGFAWPSLAEEREAAVE